MLLPWWVIGGGEKGPFNRLSTYLLPCADTRQQPLDYYSKNRVAEAFTNTPEGARRENGGDSQMALPNGG